MKKPTKAQLKMAAKIADELFVNGHGEKACRLVLEIDDNRTAGGWGKLPATIRIAQILAGNRP